jgi:hypothetical protein
MHPLQSASPALESPVAEKEPKQLKEPGRAQKRTLCGHAEGAWAAGCKPSGAERLASATASLSAVSPWLRAPTRGALQG